MSVDDERDSSNYYLDKIEGIFNHKDLISSSAKDLVAQVGSGFLEEFDLEVGKALLERVVGYEFPDKHRGYIVETGGIIAFNTDDEILLPYVRHCYVIKAKLLIDSEERDVIMHQGPNWRQIPLLIDALKSKGTISDLIIIANSHFQKGENSAKVVSENVQKTTDIPTSGLDLDTNDSRSLQILIKNSNATLLTLPKDVSEIDYDQIKYSLSREFQI